MCPAMAIEPQIQEGLQEKQLRKQLAATVRNIQWSYAIFWCNSAINQGVLAWGDGYYNGDIKTRKTTQPMELKADQMGLQRSEQLRELYESLSAGENNQQARRPTASLSAEDLTATEWYYLVCMSFTFSPGQGLPGRALARNKHIWLSDAPFADSKTFTRSLLAKSASIQTVVCFPFMSGVLELGTTEQVVEDPDLIQQVTTSFWDLPVPACSEQSISSSPLAEKDEEDMQPVLDHMVEDTMNSLENHNLVADQPSPFDCSLSPFSFTFPSNILNEDTKLIPDKIDELNPNIFEDLQNGSPEDTDDSFRMESRQLIDDETSKQSFVNPQRILSSLKGERIKNHVNNYYAKLISLDLDGDETHYTRTLSAILRNSKGLGSMSCFLNNSHATNFTVWRSKLSAINSTGGTPQKLLKKILVDTSWIQGGRSLKSLGENGIRDKIWKPEGDDASASHVLSERRRREKLNEKFIVLRSLVPSISKVDKASILGDTIEYLKELERRVEELESCRDVDLEARERRKHPDISERTSDNYGNNEDTAIRKPSANKRKACKIEEGEAEHNHRSISKDNTVDINVTVIEKEVIIEMHCHWRDCLLLEIVNALTNLPLDAHSFQSSTTDGILALTMKAKCNDSVMVSPGMVKRALNKVVAKS